MSEEVVNQSKSNKESNNWGSGKYVLVVDDEDVVLKFIRNTLEKEGFEVGTVAEGELALASVEERMPDLVILDVNMPGLNGLQVLNRLRQLTDIPVIMLSIVGDVDTISDALTAGADDYIKKPFETRELLARIMAQLGRSRKG